jgi:hypothetical protein
MSDPKIDPREIQKLKQRFEELRLRIFDPGLGAQLDQLRTGSESPFDAIVWPRILEGYKKHAGDYETTGMVNVPAAFVPKGLHIALQDKTNAPMGIVTEGNTALAGPPGTGKSTAKHATILAAKLEGYTIYSMDPKGDDAFLPAIFPSFKVISSTFDKSFLELPLWHNIATHIANIVSWFRVCFYCGEREGAVLRKALERAFARRNPSWKMVHAIVDDLAKEKGLFGWKEACLWLSERLHKMRQRYPASYASQEPGYIDMLTGDVLQEMESSDQVGEFVGIFSLNHIFEHNKHNPLQVIRTIACVDETIGLVNKEQHGRIAENPLAILMPRCREYYPLIVMTAVNLNTIDPVVLSTITTFALLPGLGEQSLRIAGLTPTQAVTARHMRRGQILFVYPGRLPWPVMARFNPLPPGLKEKRPLQSPTNPVLVVPASLEECAPEPAQIEPDPVPAPTVPAEEPAAPSGVALNAAELALLQALYARAGIELTTRTYTLAGLTHEVGDAARRKLLTLGFITATPITPSGGKGKSGKALQLTALAYERLGLKPHRRSRGGGAQSEYLIQRLHELLHGSEIEVPLGQGC